MRNGSFPSILLICLYCTLIGSCIGKVIPLIPPISHELNIPAAQAAWLISVVSVAGIVIAPFSTRLIAALGDRRLLMGAVALEIASSVLGALSQSFLVLMLGRFLEGAAFFFVATAALTLLIRTTEGTRRASAIGLFAAAIPLGIGLGIMCAGQVVNVHWRLAFWGQAAVLLLSALALPLLPREDEAGMAHHPSGNFFSIYRNYGFVKLSVAFAVTTLLQFSAISIFAVFLTTDHNVSLSTAAAISGAGLLAGIVGNVGASIMLDRGVRPAPILAVALPVLSLLCILAFVPVLRADYCVGAYAVLMFISGGIASVILSMIPSVAGAPEAMGRINAGLNQVNNIPVFIGPPLVFTCFAYGGTLLIQALLFCLTAAIAVLAFSLGLFRMTAQPEVRVTH